jgi:hypothetical protein
VEIAASDKHSSLFQDSDVRRRRKNVRHLVGVEDPLRVPFDKIGPLGDDDGL